MARFLLVDEALREEFQEEIHYNAVARRVSLSRPMRDSTIIDAFRVNANLLEDLIQEVAPLLRPAKNSRAIDPVTKILTALNFYARGSYQGQVGRDNKIMLSQQAVSRCLTEVTNILNSFVMKYIKFPQNREDRAAIKRRFYETSGIPGVCGCIDCTHIKIIRPSMDEERFLNRKHYHSLNVQVICDDMMRILNVDASYGGATHDSFIWEYSHVRDHFVSLAQIERACLLGDSGYPLREYMMIPIRDAPNDSPESRYNRQQQKTRSLIERCFGILKGRWRCLLAARELHYTPEKAGKIFIACAILHNKCIEARLPQIILSQEEMERELAQQPLSAVYNEVASEALRRGQMRRREIVDTLLRNH